MSSLVYPLLGEQMRAADPAESVWLSASAGTGKTQVLSARVLRLLLEADVRPEQILCLTFTKAGAAEMATRVNDVLADWVRLEETQLSRDLANLGASGGPEMRARARTLFASVLDCPGGGLRIDTIHAFSQWLLSTFPEEAGLTPGARPMEDRDRDMLAHRVLAELVNRWEAGGDKAMIAALEMLSERMGPDKVRPWLMRCAEAREAWFGPGGWQEPLRGRVESLLGVEVGAGSEWGAELCDDAMFDCAALRQCLAANRSWNTKTGHKHANSIESWLAADCADRFAAIEQLAGALLTQQSKIRSLSFLEKHDPDYAQAAERARTSIDAVRERMKLLQLVDLLVQALGVGRRFALAWDEAKQREGLIDFDDLIHRAADLLSRPGLGEWIRYKLDRRFDHILVDEAQDTNEAQWSIIEALTDDFFSGEGQHDNKLRTIFVVGDYKQAIFRFQGTSPENFTAARQRFAAAMTERAQSAQALHALDNTRELVKLGLDRSFRTAQPVLDFVDKAIETIGPASFGLDHVPDPHVGDDRPGLVTLWKPVPATDADSENYSENDNDAPDGAEEWLSDTERRMADKIAVQIKRLVGSFPLVKGRARLASPGDILVLVRKRKNLAGLIVARLHAAGVPVAGVDRLRLGAPLAVKDLLAALRFAAQPLDDLTLASLLVSPLVGWSQEQLLEHGHRPQGRSLWGHLRTLRHPDVQALRELLDPLLARADFEPPQALLHWLLVGPWQGRRKLAARMGREVHDPIDELLNAALAFSAAHTPSLTGFIHWFEAGEGDIKREPGAREDLVRVMTVHGSKGLQAPIVILADATGDPRSSRVRDLTLSEELPGAGGSRVLPIPDLSTAERVGPIANAAQVAEEEELQEHWRLLYVALTRAEEALFIGGALNKREAEPAADSWYARLAPLMSGGGIDDPLWGRRYEWGAAAPRELVQAGPQQQLPIPPVPPAWAVKPLAAEPRPPRPLAPSAVGEDEGADPPIASGELAAVRTAALRRGMLIHRLLERLPEAAPDMREEMGAAWLSRNAADISEDDRREMLASALAVMAEAEWAELFSPSAMAEVPLAATVGGQVIAGTADRLLITPEKVLIADFKTTRRPPETLEQIPSATLRQMGAYAAALARIYPERKIEAAVLYTQGPHLIAIPDKLLEAHNLDLATSD